MMQLRCTAPNPRNPFHYFICGTCGGRLGKHYVYRPEKLADVHLLTTQGRKPDGKLYCHSDQLGWAAQYHQRVLRRTMELGYEKTHI